VEHRDRSTGYIYELVDPRNRCTRYIGKTTQTLEQRHSQHVRKNKSPGVRAWVLELKACGMKPAILVVATVPVKELDAEEKRQIQLHLSKGCSLLNLQERSDRLGKPDYDEIFEPSGRRDVVVKDSVEPLSWWMQWVAQRQAILVAFSVLLGVALLIAGTVLDRTLPAFICAVMVVGGGWLMFPPMRYLEASRESPVNLYLTWPQMLIGQVFLCVAILVDAPDAWYLLAGGFIFFGAAVRLIINRVQGSELDREEPGYVDVAVELQCPGFNRRGRTMLLGAFATWCGAVGISGLAGAENAAGFSLLEQICLALIGLLMLPVAAAEIRKLPISRRAFGWAMFCMIIPGLGFWISTTAVEAVDDEHRLAGWLLLLMFAAMSIGCLVAGIDDVGQSGMEMARARRLEAAVDTETAESGERVLQSDHFEAQESDGQ
jgi:hypothetical protein